ncbi:MAG: methylenetetrahydrofolate reductase [NAD(P)H], partial [Verrucomicrobia bacterium]
RIATLSGSVLPAALTRRLEVASEDSDVVEFVGVDWALDQIRDLIAQGAPGYHLYILNRARSALALAAGLAA